MTRKRYLNARCPNCNVDGICPICGEKIPHTTPFSDWLRELGPPLTSRTISNHNLDYIWHNYKANWFITIEEKRFGGKPSFAQRDTHGIVKQLLETASGAKIRNERGAIVSIEYKGHYYISFEKTSPNDSNWVLINSKKYIQARETILHLLTYGNLDGFKPPVSARLGRRAKLALT